MAELEKTFRCPFEVQGEKEKTIIDIALGEDRKKRLQDIQHAFLRFHSSPKSPAIRFMLPHSVLEGVSSNQELKLKLLPYQCDILAAELAYKYDSSLVKELKPRGNKPESEEEALEQINICIKDLLRGAFENVGGKSINSFKEVAPLIENIMLRHFESGMSNPILTLGGDIPFIEIKLGGIFSYPENECKSELNKNLFNIVKTPFYPENTGRFSEEVIFAVSRDRDIASVNSNTRKKIRKQSNEALEAVGIEVQDFENDKQPIGLWIP